MKKKHLLMSADDGRVFYKQVMLRLSEFPGKSLNALCKETVVPPAGRSLAFSTTWRWKNEGSKPETETVLALQKTFDRWERAEKKHKSL